VKIYGHYVRDINFIFLANLKVRLPAKSTITGPECSFMGAT